MGFLAKQWSAPRASVSYGPLDAFWYQAIDGKSETGMIVNPDTAMRIGTVCSCVRVIAETIATLPLHIYRRLANGGKVRAPGHPLYPILHDQPNNWQTSVEFWEMMVGHVLLRGNAYAEIIWLAGRVDQLIPLHPGRITVEQLPTGRLRYKYKRANGEPMTFEQHQVLHLRGLSSDGLVGQSPITQARETFALAAAQERYGAKFFKNAASPSGVYETDRALSDVAFARLKNSIDSERAGLENAHKALILEEGLKWHQVGANGRDAQFIEGRKYQRTEICGIYRVPPHMVGDLSEATFSNIEEQGINFSVHTIRPWNVRIEKALKRDLIIEEDYFAEFLLDGLLRGNLLTRYQSHAIGLQNEFLTKNEVRLIENKNPVEDGDEFRNPITVPQQPNSEPPTDDSPGKTSPADGDEEADDADGDVEAAARWVNVMADDVASRLTKAELRELGPRVEKAHEDPARFREWCAVFYTRHAEYVEKTVEPLVQASGLCPSITATIARHICEPAYKALVEADTAETFAAVFSEQTRTEHISLLIKEWLQ